MSFENIARIVKGINMTQAELARGLGFKNSQFVSNITRGKCSLPLKKMNHFCYLTDTPRDEIKAAWMRDQSARFDEAVNDQA